MLTIMVILAIALLALAFWLGAEYGQKVAIRELLAERRASQAIRMERNELKFHLDHAEAAVRRAGIDVKKIFPWLLG